MVLTMSAIAMAAITLGLGIFVSPWFLFIFAAVIGLPLLLYWVIVRLTVPSPETEE